MTRRILIVDDIRSEEHIAGLDIPRYDPSDPLEPKDSVLIARTYTLGIQALQLMGPWDVLYLDHDLSCPGLVEAEKTGYHVACWIEEQVHNQNLHLVPKNIICISSNPAGIQKIEACWKAIQNKLKGE